MQGIVPNAPFPSPGKETMPACEWVMPAGISRRDYARTCTALPPGMPDCLEVSVIHSDEGVERSTAVIYGTHAYLIHYEFKPGVRQKVGARET